MKRPSRIRVEAEALFRLAARNVLRQRARTAMTLAAIAFGVIGLILSGGFVQDIFVQLGEAVIHSQSGHLQVAKAGFAAKGARRPDQYLIEQPDALKAQLAAERGVVDVMGRISFSGLLNNGRSDLSIVGEGIEPEREARNGTYLFISAGRQLADGDRFGALLGRGVAQALNLAPGDRATLVVSTRDGATNTLDLEVVGVFQTFSKDYDARAVKIALPAAQELLDTRGVNTLVVALARTRDTQRAAASLRGQIAAQALEVSTWEELNDFYDKTVKLYDRQFGALRLIILAMVLLSVTNTVNMTIFERVGEFGTMRALGNRGANVFALVLAESAVLGVAGAALGTALGVALALLVSAIGIPMPPPPNADIGYTAQIQLVPSVIASAFGIGVTATVLASILPALRVARTDVVEALRQNV
jgi:putative ABC transport system permease protein